ncbi:MAG: SOS response-associated peptidase family protein, partial [Deltaproteobacteria bacterium]|nr:SOS response-associated peptidase family protein [Deltaproteobacteria bacterium]
AAAHGLIAPIHNRMPVILPPEAERAWLDPALDGKPEALRNLLQPMTADALRACPVSRRVNSTHNDGPELIQASDEPSLGF